MNVVPAQVAGVAEVALASPPQRAHGGRVHPVILAAARLLGVDEVYAMGGAGAIGAFAYGVASLGLDPVDVVTGPGNNFVAAAKRAVAGVVGTDAEAGATEILIVADDTADPRLVAADLISQAEHDEQASAVLVTAPSRSRPRSRPRSRRAPRARATPSASPRPSPGRSRRSCWSTTWTAATAFSNAYAPEHLELHLADAGPGRRSSTPAPIFVGPDSPVSLGDYLAGSNHVLPTGGQARYAAGLSAATFLRPQQVIEYDRAALAAGARGRRRAGRGRGPARARRGRRGALPRRRPARGGWRSLSRPCIARSAVTPTRASSTRARATTASASAAAGSAPSAAAASRRSRPPA